MVHLRIVVPSYQSEHALDLLNETKTACNIVFLKGAAVRPEGDVILCDVVRKDASLIVADLRELDIDVEGSIAIEEIDSEISTAADEAQKHAEKVPTDPVVWEEVASRTSENVELSHTFLIYMALSMLIAAAGIYLDSVILVIGAMVVGPEFGPIAGACVAIVNREPELTRRSIRALAIGFPVGMLATYVATLLLIWTERIPDTINFDGQDLTRYISNPDFFSFYVALLAGVVGILSLTSAKSSALVGVLISVATIPAAANMGVAAAYSDWETLWGATLQLGINMATIFGGGLLTLWIQRLLYIRRRHRHLSDEARKEAGLPLGQSRRAKATTAQEPDPH